MDYIDLRSDTVTRPSPGMRQAIANAEVGDDVLGDDPTVQKLEAMVAEMFGREAALYVPSGSMGNQISLYTISHHGDEIICDEGCHIFNYEVATAAALSGLLFHVIRGRNGAFTAAEVEPLIRSEDLHSPRTRIIEVENTHNRAGGTIFPLEDIKALRRLADQRGLLMHLDGARIWHAHAVTGIALAEYAKYFESIAVCLSKALGAPVGSMVIGDRDFVAEARRTRKMFGGGMRQVGILAAAGIYALKHNVVRLAEDHQNARRLAEGLCNIEGLDVELDKVDTNMVFVSMNLEKQPQLIDSLKEQGILIGGYGQLRLVTHHDISVDDVPVVVEAFDMAVKAVML